LAGAFKDAPNLPKDSKIVINLSGRGDKDIFNVAKAVQDETFPQFLTDYLAAYPTSHADHKEQNA
jgi:tryptophan synthase beta chain